MLMPQHTRLFQGCALLEEVDGGVRSIDISNAQTLAINTSRVVTSLFPTCSILHLEHVYPSHTHTHTHTHTCTHTSTQTHTHTHTRTHTHARTHTHTHTHTRTHTRILTPSALFKRWLGAPLHSQHAVVCMQCNESCPMDCSDLQTNKHVAYTKTHTHKHTQTHTNTHKHTQTHTVPILFTHSHLHDSPLCTTYASTKHASALKPFFCISSCQRNICPCREKRRQRRVQYAAFVTATTWSRLLQPTKLHTNVDPLPPHARPLQGSPSDGRGGAVSVFLGLEAVDADDRARWVCSRCFVSALCLVCPATLPLLSTWANANRH